MLLTAFIIVETMMATGTSTSLEGPLYAILLFPLRLSIL
jgi:hypothetical protein